MQNTVNAGINKAKKLIGQAAGRWRACCGYQSNEEMLECHVQIDCFSHLDGQWIGYHDTWIAYQELCNSMQPIMNNASSLQTTVRHGAFFWGRQRQQVSSPVWVWQLPSASIEIQDDEVEERIARSTWGWSPRSTIFCVLHPFGTSLLLPMRRGYHDAAAKEFWSQNTKSWDDFSRYMDCWGFWAFRLILRWYSLRPFVPRASQNDKFGAKAWVGSRGVKA